MGDCSLSDFQFHDHITLPPALAGSPHAQRPR
jgi:hypothetical protein